MKLVEDFDRIKKRWSVKIIKLGAAASAGWLAVQGLGLAGSVPPWVPAAVTGVVFAAALGGILHGSGELAATSD